MFDLEVEAMNEYCTCGYINFVSRITCVRCGKKLRKKEYK
jgi:hypothetical protein